jgi:hypothetical protein
MNFRNRLKRLEQLAGAAGCPACHQRRQLDVLLSGRNLPDGTMVPDEELPPRCNRCGEIPERVVLIVETVVTGYEDRGNGIPQRR